MLSSSLFHARLGGKGLKCIFPNIQDSTGQLSVSQNIQKLYLKATHCIHRWMWLDTRRSNRIFRVNLAVYPLVQVIFFFLKTVFQASFFIDQWRPPTSCFETRGFAQHGASHKALWKSCHTLFTSQPQLFPKPVSEPAVEPPEKKAWHLCRESWNWTSGRPKTSWRGMWYDFILKRSPWPNITGA